MRFVRSGLLVALAVATLACPASAADVPVTYTVDTTALKLAVSGTNLTFQLHTNASCTAVVHTQVLTIDATNMQSVLKRSKPKNGVKPPKTTDIRATLTGVAPAAPLYLTVSGTGVTPVGGACQVQASTTAIAPAGASVVVRDANGTLLGPIDAAGTILLSDGGVPVSAYASPTGFVPSSGFFYASTDCSGAKLSSAILYNGFIRQMVGIDGTTLYYGPPSAPLTTVGSFDYAPVLPANCNAPQTFVPPDRCCCESPVCTSSFLSNVGAPTTMDISVFVPPFSVSFE